MSDLSEQIYIGLLRMVAPAKCFECNEPLGHRPGCRLDWDTPRALAIDEPSGGQRYGWGWLGKGRPVSFSIVEVWMDNEFLQKLGGTYASYQYVLTEKGQRAADNQLKADVLKLPSPRTELHVPSRIEEKIADDTASNVVEGERLFSPAGTCQLCMAKMTVFGQVSHAKSHVNKGDAVIIETVQGKKIPRLTSRLSEVQIRQALAAESGPPEDDSEPLFLPTGLNKGTCQLCQKPVHLFGWTSHAMGHMARLHPVEIRRFQGKPLHRLLRRVENGDQLCRVMDADSRYALRIPVPARTHRLEEAQAGLSEEFLAALEHDAGVNAILLMQRAAGLPTDVEAASVSWDAMSEDSRTRTMQAAKIVGKANPHLLEEESTDD